MFFFHICQNSSQSWSSLIIGRTFKWIRVNWGCQYYSHTKPNLGDKHKFTSYAFDMHAQSFTKQRSWKKIDKNCQIFGSTKQQLPSNHQIACERALRTTKKKGGGSKRLMDKRRGWNFLVDERVKKIFGLFMIRFFFLPLKLMQDIKRLPDKKFYSSFDAR